MKAARDKLCKCGHEAAAHLVNPRTHERGECSICGRSGCAAFHTHGRSKKEAVAIHVDSTERVTVDASALARVRVAAGGVAKAMSMLCTEIEKLEGKALTKTQTTAYIDAPLVMLGKNVMKSIAESKVGGGLRRILTALAQTNTPLTDAQICIRADLSSSGGTYGTYLSRARTEGWIVDLVVNGAPVRSITAEGLKKLGAYELLPAPGKQLRAYWQRKIDPTGLLKSGIARIFNVVCTYSPSVLSLATIAMRADIEQSGGSFGTYVSRLRTLMLVEDAVINGEKGLVLGQELR